MPDEPEPYDADDEGPITRMLREQVTAEQREAARLDRLLDAVLNQSDPIAEGRRAASRMWAEVCALLRRRA